MPCFAVIPDTENRIIGKSIEFYSQTGIKGGVYFGFRNRRQVVLYIYLISALYLELIISPMATSSIKSE